MTWMTGSIGAILAVLLLGCTRTCQMVRASLTVGFNQVNQTVSTDRRQTGTPGAHACQVGESRSPDRGRIERDLRT
jgi:hypothetical protein